MNGKPDRRSFYNANFQGNLLAGLLTVAPLIAVWLVFDFFLNTLSEIGHPLAVALTDFLDAHIPALTPILASVTVRWLIAVMVALLALYSIGVITSRVIGQQLIVLFEKIITRIPLVETIYSASKKLVDVLRPKPDSAQRVVLIGFPHEGLKTIAFVMRVFKDSRTGEDLATVFVPTAPNPTTGYLEILPVAKLIPTDIPTEQAMTMILSGGAVAPDKLSISRPENP
ncbi:MAG: DUF502 domain-containing protein [Alphaproteobacteria bacterium]|nr:DUF502 domain-containing protein [Alphaproteobacteria bacterium]MDE1985257.1 DUF502 domain-containing protein [Alphaproteobacteria bacterium]MDE2162596.1 DUF502 domain-containing protein [Alphaproteobacteria bacterium]MDE2266881.1 DUF502 domain-containing protein [Alphaproteobacteria bacterium]MDE2500499.1 DUF502 domain-containing protein [Alphaproteobacteria bacterium]